ncbi:hypothetical protein [Rhodohalobacter barkolensis]|uniref:Type II secretion system protein n=1 Tax=Rhodohalobacter barkolensis TaxID=2053187 RepID=A0A2N0VKA3_9BACT|nr:hypothetical protein [Rhodohalobacter barkolensis]PKD44608.1 hypothetical protein CWD77_03855 [Rhodohalobacter barkolensis]
MGQQQLLLVILVTIIVGIATVVAINTFGSAADSANIDAVRQDVASIASSAQGYFMKPAMLGGGSRDFSNFTFDGVAVPGEIQDEGTDLIISNENGTYEITSRSTDEIEITASPSSSVDYTPGETGTDDDLVATIEPNELNFNS